MGIAASVCEIRTTGATTNGGGFVTGASGVDYSQQDAAQWALTGVTSSGAGNTVLDANAHADMVGNWACVVSGTNTNQMFTAVESVVAGVSITFYTNKAGTSVASGVMANGVINIGGAFKMGASSANRTDDDFFEAAPDTGGNTYYFKYNASAHAAAGTLSFSATGVAVSPHRWVGYNSSRTDAPSISSGNQPTINMGGFILTFGTDWSALNCTFTGTNTSVVVGGNRVKLIDCKVTNSSGTAGRNAIAHSSTTTSLRCEAVSTNGIALNMGSGNGFAINCYVHDSDKGVVCGGTGNSSQFITGTVIDTVVTSGIDITGAQGLIFINGNTLYGASSPAGSSIGLKFAATTGNIIFTNNIIFGFVTGVSGASAANATALDIGYNCFYNNTTDRTNFATGTNDIALDPAFVGAPNGNFATGTNVQRVGYPGTFPGGLTVSYRDIGAVQGDQSGWWSVPAASDIRSNVTARNNSLTTNVTGTLISSGGRSRMASNGARLNLLENASATGSSFLWPGGQGQFYAEATWGGGTVKLQAQTPNGTWIDVDSASLTANGHKTFTIPPGTIRANVATATAVYAYAVTV